MKLLSLIPTIFYADTTVGLTLFVDALGFTVVHKDTAAKHSFFILQNGSCKLHIVENAEFALKDRPELRIETDDIAATYKEVYERLPQLLHPNLRAIKQQPWGLQEFALLDSSGVCIIIQQ